MKFSLQLIDETLNHDEVCDLLGGMVNTNTEAEAEVLAELILAMKFGELPTLEKFNSEVEFMKNEIDMYCFDNTVTSMDVNNVSGAFLKVMSENDKGDMAKAAYLQSIVYGQLCKS